VTLPQHKFCNARIKVRGGGFKMWVGRRAEGGGGELLVLAAKSA